MPPDPVRIEDTQAWLIRAHKDIRAASIDCKDSPPLLEDALFHCQQAVEKCLKAFLVWHDLSFRKTHDLVEIGKKCVSLDTSLESLLSRAASLTQYAWKYRYPGNFQEPGLTETENAMDLCKEIYKAIIKRIPEEAQPPKLLF